MILMNSKHIKNIVLYAAILALGLAVGRLGAKVPQWLKADYVEGNYQSFYPDAATRVVVYGTKTCPYCQKTREYLSAHHIPYADIDVNTPGKGQLDYRSFGQNNVPLILIGNRRITGFNQAVIETALAQLKPAS